MKLFIDTGSVAEVEEIAAWGVLAGATTNPSLLAKEDGDPGDDHPPDLRAGRRAGVRRGRVRQRRGDDRRGPRARRARRAHRREGAVLAEGLAATRALCADGIRINMTLVFSAKQALLSAEAGATYISCFMGRLDDISVDSTAVVREIVETLGPAAHGPGARGVDAPPEHVVTAAKLGCEVATVPAKVLRQMLDHPLTRRGSRSSRPTGSRGPSSRSGCRADGRERRVA